jgi:hypothetical protein
MNGLFACLVLTMALNPLERGEGLRHSGGLVLRDVLLILGIGLFLAILLTFWARSYVRRSKKRSHHRHNHRSPAPIASSPNARLVDAKEPGINSTQTPADAHHGQHHHRRRRRRRRDHRSRNPSLAETGGLPPQRSEPSPPPVS